MRRMLADLASVLFISLYISATVLATFLVFYGVALANPEVPLSADWWFWLYPCS